MNSIAQKTTLWIWIVLFFANCGMGQDSLTPPEIADEIEKLAREYQSVGYSTLFSQSVETQVEGQGDPQKFRGHGRTNFKRHQKKYFVDYNSLIVSSSSGIAKQNGKAGYDGVVHWHENRGDLVLAEKYVGVVNHEPTEIFWHAALNRDWLLVALRHESAKIVGRETIDGIECVVIESQPRVHNLRYSIALNNGFLPLRAELKSGEQLEVQTIETLRKIKQTDSGVWYPGQILIERPNRGFYPYDSKLIAIRNFETIDEDLAIFDPPVASADCIVDRRTGKSFCNDPWWHDLSSYLDEEFDWPKVDLYSLQSLSSFESATIGKQAPELQVSEWVNGEPDSWNQSKLSVVYFNSGHCLYPGTANWAALKSLHQRYESLGLQVFGIATADTDPEMTKSTINELEVKFPVGIDAPGGDWGESFAAFGIPQYMGIVLVDESGVVHGVESGSESNHLKLEMKIQEILKLSGVEVLPELAKLNQQLDGIQQLDAKWKELAAVSEPNGSLTGVITSGFRGNEPIQMEGATIKVKPIFRFLMSSQTGSYILLTGGGSGSRSKDSG